eukprot:761603-Pleurochrysis_carterae.AAC.1
MPSRVPSVDGCASRGGLSSLTHPVPLPRSQKSVKLNYYIYHAESSLHQKQPNVNFESPAHLENVNVANLQGVLTYLHYEVLPHSKCYNPPLVTRALGIDRIARYNVTSMATEMSGYDEQAGIRHQFAYFTNMDDGRGWHSYADGFDPSVGCGQPWYPGWEAYEGALFFTLPGRCPGSVWEQKTDACMRAESGGECADPNGTATCTWRADPIGFVTLDELAGISDHGQLCNSHPRALPLEYDPALDAGHGVCFWNGRADPDRCKERASKLNELFKRKYPHIPGDVPAPICMWRRSGGG